jgi:hypothetical protein
MQNISLILKGAERLRIKEIRQMGVEKNYANVIEPAANIII